MKSRDEIIDFFVFFPYLKTSKAVTFLGVTLYPFENLSNLPPDLLKPIKSIGECFYMTDNYQIKNMAVATIKERYDLADFGFNQKLHKSYLKIMQIQELFLYIYSNLHPTFLDPFLDRALCNVFVFRNEPDVVDLYSSNDNLRYTGEKKLTKQSFKNGFSGLLNGKNYISLTKNNKIYPPTCTFNQNYSQDLALLKVGITEDSEFNFINNDSKLSLIMNNTRLLKSMQWYNRSNNKSLSNEEQLINLSIAFEGLLDLERAKGITNRFKDAILIVLGNNKKLESWADQFYLARSEIVHRGSASELFYDTSPKQNTMKRYRQLTSYGRIIFQILFNSVATGEYFKTITGLHDLFTTNQERFEILITNVRNSSDISETMLSSEELIQKIEDFSFIREENLLIPTILTAVSLPLERMIEKFNPEDQKLLKFFIEEKKIEEKLLFFEEVRNSLKKHKVSEKNALLILKKLVKVAWSYLFMEIYAIKESRKETEFE